jgi:hypothetical protein
MGEVISVGIPSIFGLTGEKTTYKNEGVLLSEVNSIDFVGDGVSATSLSGVLTVEVDGGSSEPLITTMLSITPSDTTHATAASAVYELATYLGGLIPPPATPESIGADPAGAAAAAEASAKSYADVLVSAVWKDQGNFDASSGAWPTSVNVAGGGGDILAGYLWKVTTGGTLTGGVVVDIGDILRALVPFATNSAVDWAVTEGNDGYVAENAASKAVNFSIKNDTLYPSTKAVDDNYVAISALRYVINQAVLVANAYTVLSTDVSAYGNKILKVVNTVPTTITLPNPNALLPAAVVGDSLNIRQGGMGGITITGSITGVNTTSVQHTTLTLIAESPTSWMSVGG